MAKTKTWKQKAAAAKAAHTVVLEKPFAGTPAGATLFIPDPRVIASYMEERRAGDFRSMLDMRRDFAEASKADAACPVTSAIHARIVAEAALEELSAGKKPSEVTPFWRVIDENSPIAGKLSCGPDFIRTQRELEKR